MSLPTRNAQRFVKALLSGEDGTRDGDTVRAGAVSLMLAEAEDLASSGVLRFEGETCRPTDAARSWLRRAMVEADGFAAQHRLESRAGEPGVVRNLAESPLTRLAHSAGAGETPFLDMRQLEAGERVRRLAARARMSPRLTMDYAAEHVAGSARGRDELADTALEARKRLAGFWAALPRDCAGVIMDVCVFEKGLQQVEQERGWPRRSAKLVLRIGLDQLAEHLGLGTEACGPERGRARGWRDSERPPMFPADPASVPQDGLR